MTQPTPVAFDENETEKGVYSALVVISEDNAALNGPKTIRITAIDAAGVPAEALNVIVDLRNVANLPLQVSAAERPHILVIMADDLGWSDVGYHGNEIQTPNIDQLAMEGVRLNQFYTQSICTPTRSSLLTGRYPIRYGFQFSNLSPWSRVGLPLEERTLPQALKEVGYRTAITGKWNMGHSVPFLPMQRGFDHQYGMYAGPIGYFNHVMSIGGERLTLDWHRNEKPLREKGYVTTLIAQEAVRIIEAHDPSQPLFLYVPFSAPHTPLQAPQEYIAQYQHVQDRKRRIYSAMVTCMDDAIGDILTALEERGIRKDTLIFFCSDNGGNPEQGADNGPLREGKGSLYEGGVRVPALIAYPRRLEKGTVVDKPLHIVDLYPTLLRLAGASLDQPLPLDGLDVWPVIAEGKPSPHAELLHNVVPWRGAIRIGDWKLYVWAQGGSRIFATVSPDPIEIVELFNIAADPEEQFNLAGQFPEKVQELFSRLVFYANQAAPILPLNTPRPPDFKAPRVLGEDHLSDASLIYVESAVSSEEVIAEVRIEDVEALLYFQFDLSFDSQILEVMQIDEGEFLKRTGGNTIWVPPQVNNDAGTLTSFQGVRLSSDTVSGEGTLATVTFKIKKAGTSLLEPTNVKLSNDAGDQILASLQVSRVDVTSFHKPTFDLLLPEGISLIHLPLKITVVGDNAVEIQTIGDLFDVLGPNRVSTLIADDPAAGVWRSYFGVVSRDTLADARITDNMGIIAIMKQPVAVRLQGTALGTDGVSAITLHPGINLIGVPLMSSRLERVSDLLSLEGIKNNATAMIVSDNGSFKVVAQPGDDGDIPLIGGQSFGINAREASVVEITGVAWDNVSAGAAAAPPMTLVGHQVDGRTPVLTVHGVVVNEATRSRKKGFRVTVKNLSAGTSLNTLSSSQPLEPRGYRVTFVDFVSSRAAKIGDILEVTVDTPSSLVRVQPLRHVISAEEVRRSEVHLPNLTVDEIPAKTELMPNFPNPANPETWIPFQLAEAASVTLTIYDVAGRVVRTLEVGNKPAGMYVSKDRAIYWDGRDDFGGRVASGIYFYDLTANDFSATHKMLILK